MNRVLVVITASARAGWLSLLVTSILAVGCSGEDPAGPGPESSGDVATVDVDQASLDFDALDATASLTATARDAAGAGVADAEIAWTMEGSGVVEINEDEAAGISAGSSRVTVRALANGVETIHATAEDVTATVAVTVEQVAAGLEVSVSSSTLRRVGETAQIETTVVDAGGTPVTAPEVLENLAYSSADPQIAAVDASGRVTANWMGATSVVASSGTLEGTADVVVDLTDALGGPFVGAVVPCEAGMAGPFPCDGIDLASYLPLTALGVPEGAAVNDVWGWTDEQEGRRYALVARSDGVTFVDVTDALQPRPIGWLPEAVDSPLWRDLKVYGNHAFVVADLAPAHGMQVFDLTRLRGVSVFTRFTEDARYTNVSAAHNIAINEETGFAYVVGGVLGGETCGGGLHMIDLAEPKSPIFAGCFADPSIGIELTGYTHDVQCVLYTGPDPDYAGREICFGSNETAISIVDVTDKQSPAAVSTATYPDAGYVHQGWLTEDHRYFLQNDELDERQGNVAAARMLVWDVTDLDDPVLVAEHLGPTAAIDHNLYVLGSVAYHSNYTFGLRVIDVADPPSPLELGFFDTHPSDDAQTLDGSWSNYPFFDDGRVIVTSGAEGLFILDPGT